LKAYGWEDINLAHDFYEVDYLPENDRVRYTISPDARKEVLKRLLKLNHEIHEQEMKARLHLKRKRNGVKSTIDPCQIKHSVRRTAILYKSILYGMMSI